MLLNTSNYRYLPLIGRINETNFNTNKKEEEKQEETNSNNQEETFVDKSSDLQAQLNTMSNNNIAFVDFSKAKQTKIQNTNVPVIQNAEENEQTENEDSLNISTDISRVVIPVNISIPKNAKVIINDDGTIDVIKKKYDFLNMSSSETIMHYDKEGNLLTRTEKKGFDGNLLSQTLIYDKDNNMIGGEITFLNGKTISLPENSEVKYVSSVDENGLTTISIDVAMTETIYNADIYDPSKTVKDQIITTVHYNITGNKTGTNIVTKTRNPNATIDVEYKDVGLLCVLPPVKSGKISFDSGAEDFIIPEGADISFKDGKIIVAVIDSEEGKKVTYTIGNDGVEKIEFEPAFFANDTEEYNFSDLSALFVNYEENKKVI